MSRFRFKLERLGRVRRIQEEQEREVWLAAEYARQDAEAAEARARADVASAESLLRARQADKALGVGAVLQAQAALERVHGTLRRASERTRTASYQADRLRVPWEERRKEVRGLERLREQARVAWRSEELQREARELDEVAARRAPGRGELRPIREKPDAQALQGPGAGPVPGAAPQALAGSDRSTEASLPDRS